jgi:glutaminase
VPEPPTESVDVDDALSVYFRQCSVRVTCRDLAVLGATLANGGRNPMTGLQGVDRAPWSVLC